MKNSKNPFKRKALAASISSLVLGSLTAYAQDDEGYFEEVEVIGIRASLQSAMDTKRNATGVVDAINAEDIGKFPDSNLAESLQRITGVSIDRRDGEGSQVTVRGFGGGNNLVTLNGRQLPAADVPLGGGNQGTGRSFNFANLASESVSAIEVYKTGRASNPSGGLGATINIKTRKPLDTPGLAFSVGAKAVSDSTNETGNDVTPELSGFFSWSDDDETLGVALTGSYQERDSGSFTATVNDWRLNVYEPGIVPYDNSRGNLSVVNEPIAGQLAAVPNDTRYHFEDTHRVRNNTQLTLQYRPIESVTLTGDITYAENKIQQNRGDQTLWHQQNYDAIEWDGNPVIASPVMVSENIDDVTAPGVQTKDHSFEQQHRHIKNTLESLGFNADWQVNSDLNLSFDVHNSRMDSTPVGPAGSSEVTFSMAVPIVSSQQIFFGDGLPQQTFGVEDSRGNGNGIVDVADLGSQYQRFYFSEQRTDVTEVRLDGAFEFENGRLDFGFGSNSLEMAQRQKQNLQRLGDWGVANPGEIPADLVETFCLTCQFDDFDTSRVGPNAQVAFRADATELARWGSETYGHPYTTAISEGFDQDHSVKEDIISVYAQLSLNGELFDKEVNVTSGIRFEETSVESTTYTALPDVILWTDNNDFRLDRTSTIVPSFQASDYYNILPNLDIDFELTDSLKARVSRSTTISRTSFFNLRAADNPSPPSGPTTLGNFADGSGGNPGLEPLKSENLDLSIEWYFDDTSYVSFGIYEKRVDDFIGTQTTDEPLYGLRDPTSGAAGSRSGAALDALAARSLAVTETSLFLMTAILDNPDDFPNGAAEYDLSRTLDVEGVQVQFAEAVATLYDVTPDENDPLFDFQVDRPINEREAVIGGFEVAVQHFFGDSGFGVQANYTSVNGDVSYDVSALPSEDQFALVGLSDTANVVLMYENYGFSARLAYNWRDKFLDSVDRGSFNNPSFTEKYEQIDLNVSYSISDSISVTAEAINLTGQSLRQHARSPNQMWFAQELGPRYLLGARYTF